MPTLTAKIEKQIESLDAKIKQLSGNHLTNTPKRQREQRERDRKIADYTAQAHVLQYLQEKELAEGLTPLEAALTTASFYETLLGRSNYARHCQEHKLPSSIYPTMWPDDQKRLKKGGIVDEASLRSAILEFDELRARAIIPPCPQAVKIRELSYKAEMLQGVDIQFSPPELVEQLMTAACLEAGSRVLEPEAGSGCIADAVKKVTPNVDCVELNHLLRELLELKGHRLIGSDFLELPPQPVYDAVLMNPPFRQECEHIRHAYGFLKPDGTLVTVCSPRVSDSQFRKYCEFRDWLTGHAHSIQRLQHVKFEMTDVYTDLLVVHRAA